MWFKRVLLGYCAASLAVTIVTASSTKDAVLPHRRHVIERLNFPSLGRRQQPDRNQTTSSEILQSTSDVAITSSIFVTSEVFQTSTSVQAPSEVSTPEPTPTPASTSKPSAETTESSFNDSSSSNGGGSSSSGLFSTETTALAVPTTEQQPPTTPSSDSSEIAASSTMFDITSVISSTTEETQVPSTLDVSLSLSTSLIEPTVTIPQTTSSLQSTNAFSPTSALETPEETVLLPSETMASSSNDERTTSSAMESAQSSVPATSTQTPTAEPSSATISSLIASTELPILTTIPEQQSTSVSSSLSLSISSPESSSTSQDPVTSSPIPDSTSLPQQTFTTPTSEQASESTLVPISSSTDSQISSGDVTILPTSDVQSTTALPMSSADTGSNTQSLVSSIELPSSSAISTVEPDPVPTQVESSSVGETPSPSSILDTMTMSFASFTEPTLSSSSEWTMSSSFPEPIPTSSLVMSSFAESATSSLPTDVSLTSEQLPTSSSIESVTSIDIASSISSPIVSSADSAFPSATPTEADATSSVMTIPSSDAQTQILPTETATTASLSSSMSLLTTIASETLAITSEAPVPSDLGTTGAFPSLSSESEVVSSFLPSETLTTNSDVPTVSSLEITTSFLLVSSTLPTFVLPSTQPESSEQLSASTSTLPLSTLSVLDPSEALSTQSLASTIEPAPASSSLSLTLDNASSILSSSSRISQILSSEHPTSVVVSSTDTTISDTIPTSELRSSSSMAFDSESSLLASPTDSALSTFASTGVFSTTSAFTIPSPSSVTSNKTLTRSSLPSGVFTATFSTVYISSVRSSALDLSTVAFSLFSSVTGAAVNYTDIRTSSSNSNTMPSDIPGTQISASESLASTTTLGVQANSTWSSPLRPSLTATIDLSSGSNGTSTVVPGITFSRSVVPTELSMSSAPGFNKTQAETLQTSSVPAMVNSTKAVPVATATTESTSSARTVVTSSTSTPRSDEALTKSSQDTENTKTAVVPHVSTSTPSETASAGSPPPLTTSQTAGVAVGATTGLLIAVVAAVFIARRYHASKHGKRMSTGSVYPKVAYLYDPKTGGDGGAAEALMSGGTGGLPPGGAASRAALGFSKHMQRHSTGTTSMNRFASTGNPFRESLRDPSSNRYSDYARLDTARALSAAVAGYGASRKHSSSYTKHPSHVTDPFSDHVIPSPTFAPFSPDDIRRPELKSVPNAHDGRGEYSQMPVDSYAYLNTAASMYPPVSPYEGPSTQGPSPFYDPRRRTVDSNPFADPFEHDVLLQVDERNRTSDSVTIFAPSPNLISPRTPRTPVGPKLPVKQPNGMTSARSLLSPVAAQYMHKAQEVKIPRKSIASPVLVQVGRSPVIKPFSPPPAAPEPRGWDDIKRHSEKRFSDERSVPAPLQFGSPVVQRKPVPTSHSRMKPSLTGTRKAPLGGDDLSLTVNIPNMYKKPVGLDVPNITGRPDPAHEDMSSDPVVREKRSRELRFADPALIGKEF